MRISFNKIINLQIKRAYHPHGTIDSWCHPNSETNWFRLSQVHGKINAGTQLLPQYPFP